MKKQKQEPESLEAKYSALLSEKSELEYELAELKSSAEKIMKQDDEIRILHENVRQIKHNMKNHLMVIASYLNSAEHDSAKEYTSQILDKLNTAHSYVETGNSLMNHILNEKLNKAREAGISVKAEIENLTFAKMKSIDFSAMLSNILDNAIEACKNEMSPEINVIISARRGYDTVLVKNKITDSVLGKNPDLATEKADKERHGIGVSQIKGIVEKYDGLCDFYEEDGFFCVCAFIPA